MKKTYRTLFVIALPLVVASFCSAQTTAADQNQAGQYGVQPTVTTPLGPVPANANNWSDDTSTNIGISNAPWNLDMSNVPKIMYNSSELTFSDAQPGIINGQLLIPVRSFAEQTGATVSWLDATQEVVINMPNDQSMTLTVVPQTNADDFLNNTTGRPERFSNTDPAAGMSSGLWGPQQVILIGDHAYMPLSLLATAFNGTSNWDQDSGTVTISNDQSGVDSTATMPDMKAPDTNPNDIPMPDTLANPSTGN